jgi:hypothetical protein
MSDLISRQKTIDAMRELPYGYRGIVWDILNSLPSAEPEQKHGQWLTKEYMHGDHDVGIDDMWVDRLAEQSDYYAYCSICNKDAEYNAEGSLILSDYCPNCGARMEESE